MSYDTARDHLERAAASRRTDPADGMEDLIAALEALTSALEADLTQVKMALGHVARQVEERH